MFLFDKKTTPNLETLRKLFNEQVKKLEVELPTYEAEKLWASLEKNLKDFSFVSRGNIPLLIVTNSLIPEGMEKIHGHTKLELENVIEENPVVAPYYLLLDVDDGRKAVAKSPQDSLKLFKKQTRLPFTLNESIALLRQYPETLKDHYLTACGSFYKKDEQEQPLLWLLDDDKHPELHYAWHHIAHGSYGAGSSAIRFYPVK
jgi:hypothetical protein